MENFHQQDTSNLLFQEILVSVGGCKTLESPDSMDHLGLENVQSSRSQSLLTPDLFPPEYYPSRDNYGRYLFEELGDTHVHIFCEIYIYIYIEKI